VATNTRSPGQVVQSSASNYMPHAISACMTSGNYTIIVMRTWAYKRNEKVRFYCIWTSGKGGSHLVCCTILISQLSLNVFIIWELSIQNNPQIFVLVNRFYVLTTQCQQWSEYAFCTFSLERHRNSFVAVESNPMRFCIRLAHLVIFATKVHLYKAHKYLQQTSSHVIKLPQCNTLF